MARTKSLIKTEQVTVRIVEHHMASLRAEAFIAGCTVQDVIKAAIAMYISEHVDKEIL